MTSEVFKSIASAKGIAFVLVAWGVPAAIGMAAWWIVALPAWQERLVPDSVRDRLAEANLSGLWMFLLAWLLITLVLGLNSTFFFRLFEGYYLWKPLAERRRTSHWLHRENLRLAERLTVAEQRAKASGTSDPKRADRLRLLRSEAAEARRAARARVLPVRRLYTDRPLGGLPNWRDYPAEGLLPTALGNRIRAFERYGNARFGLDIIILWYEFVGVAEDQVRDQIEAARQEVEVFLAGSVVFALFTVATLAPLASPGSWPDHGRPLVIAGLIGVLISLLIYRRAVNQAGDWGAAVTALVNTHRVEVARAFGLVLPDTLEAERRFWRALNGFVRTGSTGWDAKYDSLTRLRPLPGNRAEPPDPTLAESLQTPQVLPNSPMPGLVAIKAVRAFFRR
ncbi:hypothetical protein [Kribbella catacumbae]|uniref:hypothetical protein n=1 Tax=Kribbella catacumbae TaxID=460086 RepID=UPI000364FB6F|nr:hypothetical protein [Kribbella catacumbae]